MKPALIVAGTAAVAGVVVLGLATRRKAAPESATPPVANGVVPPAVAVGTEAVQAAVQVAKAPEARVVAALIAPQVAAAHQAAVDAKFDAVKAAQQAAGRPLSAKEILRIASKA